MKFEIITLFPDFFTVSLKQSLIGKAVEKKLFDIEIINLRDFATDKHRTVDSTPFGGGGGMVMKVEPLDNCLKHLGYKHKSETESKNEKEHIVLTSASGKLFNQQKAIEFSLCDRMTFICGHYLGIDERINDLYDIVELSIGDYILTGGEAASMVMLESIARLIPKVLGNFESAMQDAYMDQITGTPCYTRPAEYEGLKVPDILSSGDHKLIKKFRREEAIKKCLSNRPDLLENAELTKDERALVEKLKKEKKK